ncbi:MAG: NUDIX hydrolase [Acidimicrobiia bacterium]
MSQFRTIGSRTVAEEAFLHITRATIATPTGDIVKRVVVNHPGAVAVVPILEGDVFLIDQYRAPIGRNLLEIPAGKLDVPGEDRREAAKRELEEEVGFTPGRLDHLTDLLTTPGFCDEVITIYRAIDLEAVPVNPIGAEEEHATIIRIPLADAVDRVRDGVITDAKTVAGLLLAADR